MLRIYLLILVLLGLLPSLSFATEGQAKSQPVVATTKAVTPNQATKSVQTKPANTNKTTASKAKATKAKHTAANHHPVKHTKSKHVQLKHGQSKHSQAKNNKSKSAKYAHNKTSRVKTRAPAPTQESDDDDTDNGPEGMQTSSSVTIPRIESPKVASSSTTRIDANTKSQQSLIDYASRFVGTNYRFGGRSPDTGFDCSGYVSYVYGHAVGIALPHNASAISRVGARIPRADLRPGDLVFFGHFRRAISHVGIYMGNNRFIHASSSRTGYVQISDLREHYWMRNFEGARRLMASNSAPVLSMRD